MTAREPHRGPETLDVVIVGAGLSGIGAACHLRRECPELSFSILESRERMGGTWDIFRYPGIRSDSDMYTLGYDFKPWKAAKAIADGPSILEYIRETAREEQIEQTIRYDSRVIRAAWSSEDACWTLTVRSADDGESTLRARFVMMCAGYFSYEKGHAPEFPGRESFQGDFIYPQFWPEQLDYTGKRVVVIGSGATAMTLVPSLAEKAAEVVMLQRSPTYVIDRPSVDRVANLARKLLPDQWAYDLTRWKNTLLQRLLYRRTRTSPEKVRNMLLDRVREGLGSDYDIDTHFTPSYDPWDQRLCLIPDGDLFAAIKSGRARVVTDEIDRVTPDGILLKSGQELQADVIVSATGLEITVCGEVELEVDGRALQPADTFTYKGVMCSDIPNMVQFFGYINASWTLRSDLISHWTCRVLNHMRATGTEQVTPRVPPQDQGMSPRPWITEFHPGYIQRALERMPKQGDHLPWLNPQDYVRDRQLFLREPIDDGYLEFREAADAGNPAEAGRAAATA
jgi:monooxygenase